MGWVSCWGWFWGWVFGVGVEFAVGLDGLGLRLGLWLVLCLWLGLVFGSVVVLVWLVLGFVFVLVDSRWVCFWCSCLF